METLWFVAYTRPRCEKKIADYCKQEGIHATLPLYNSACRYGGRSVVFQKPLFPGYVFLRLEAPRSRLHNKRIVKVLSVDDQAAFDRQLEDILRALDANTEIRMAPAVVEGSAVRVKTGPLRGMEGWVDKRIGLDWLVVRLDFISQGVAVRIPAYEVELR
jgi:transcription antitermination factor NusG